MVVAHRVPHSGTMETHGDDGDGEMMDMMDMMGMIYQYTRHVGIDYRVANLAQAISDAYHHPRPSHAALHKPMRLKIQSISKST